MNSKFKSPIFCAVLTLAAMASSACTVSQDEYAEKAAKTICEKSLECAEKIAAGDDEAAKLVKGLVDSLRGEKDACIKETAAMVQVEVDSCKDWDGRLAHKCLKVQEKAECETPDPDATEDTDANEETEDGPCEELSKVCMPEDDKKDENKDEKESRAATREQPFAAAWEHARAIMRGE